MLDVLCSLFDLSTHYVTTLSTILTTILQVLSTLQYKLSSTNWLDLQQMESILGICNNIQTKIKALMLGNEQYLVTNLKFAKVLALCKTFEEFLVDNSKLWNQNLVFCDTLIFTTTIIADINKQLDLFIINVAALNPHYDVDIEKDEDQELIHELKRIKKE